MNSSWSVLIISLTLVAGCNRHPSSVAPTAEGPGATDAPPPGSTRPSTEPATPQSPGRAVPVGRPNGPVIIDGPGGGSPGTR